MLRCFKTWIMFIISLIIIFIIAFLSQIKKRMQAQRFYTALNNFQSVGGLRSTFLMAFQIDLKRKKDLGLITF